MVNMTFSILLVLFFSFILLNQNIQFSLAIDDRDQYMLFSETYSRSLNNEYKVDLPLTTNFQSEVENKVYSYEENYVEKPDKSKKDKDKSDDEDKYKDSYGKLNFVAVGDWDCNSNAKKTVKNIKKLSPEVVIGLGDYSYGSSAKCWFKLVEDISDKLKITLGNHDTDSSKKTKEYREFFGLEKQYFSFNFENIHFLSLSTEVPYDDDSEQYDFVISDLKKYSKNPFIDWIIVFFHRQAYGSGSTPENEDDFAETYHPIFEKYGVNLALQAHQHIYERIFPLAFDEDEEYEPIITDESYNTYDAMEGVMFITVGTGGATATGLSSTNEYTAERFVKNGVLNMEIVNNGKTLKGTFYGNDKKIYDEFTINK